ncbi:MAG: guanylate kinase, partial [Planctomycetota bacterium]
MEKTGKLVVISGPSGTGKSSIAHEVVRRTSARFSVSMTTRKPREGELDGREYHFVDRTSFQQMMDKDELLEHAEVFGQLYGTPRGPIEEAIAAGETILLDIDVQGGAQVKAKMPEATFVLIVPPDEGELNRRLRERGSEN